MAPGSQAWNGVWADLVRAPTSTSTRATDTTEPEGEVCRRPVKVHWPVCWPSSTKPANMARPPTPVMSSASWAAARAAGWRSSVPMSRNDVTDVSSQKMNSSRTSSAITRPVMAPAKATRSAATLGASSWPSKYEAA